MARQIKLMSLGIENFKGIKRFSIEPNGRNAEIAAENRKGKTTTYDGFLWLLFDKDSEGKQDFDIRPLDEDNNIIPDIVVKVMANLEIDGVNHFFRKEHHERIIKGVVTGYTSKYWIDEVSKTATEYANYVKDIVSEHIFKLMTNLRYYNELHWVERRKIQGEVAGDIPKPKGYEELFIKSELYKDLDEYKKFLREQVKRLKEEREGITPRIDEILRNLEQPQNGKDTAALKEQRKGLKSKMAACKNMRQEILDQEKQRQKKQNELNRLEVEKRKRELDLQQPDPTKVKKLRAEQEKLSKHVFEAREEINKATTSLHKAKANLEANMKHLERKQSNLDEVRQEKTRIESQKELTVCYACGKPLDKNVIKEATDKKIKMLEQLDKQAEALKIKIETIVNAVEKNEKVVANFETKLEDAKANVLVFEEQHDKGVKEIEAKIKALPPQAAEPESDQVLFNIITQIKELKAEIGEPANEQLQAIENNLSEHEAELEKVNAALAQSDRLEKDRERKNELQAREQEIAQLIADAERMKAMIEDYKIAESQLIADAVDAKYKHVTFKMYEVLLKNEFRNGKEEREVKQCCDTLLDGKPYGAWSSGEEIFGGLDIVNTLSEHYDFVAPLFIDHKESMTLPIETNAQTITLRVAPGQKELKVKIEAEKEKAVA